MSTDIDPPVAPNVTIRLNLEAMVRELFGDQAIVTDAEFWRPQNHVLITIANATVGKHTAPTGDCKGITYERVTKGGVAGWATPG